MRGGASVYRFLVPAFLFLLQSPGAPHRMSVTVSKADGVTVLTLTSDPRSPWPPLCQILGDLCYSPVCCSVSQHLRSLNRTSQTVLGTLQIIVGLLNIVLGAIFLNAYSPNWMLMYYTGFPFWLGTLFIVFGVMCILSEKYPSVCVVVLTVILNLAGVAFAIAAIVLYGLNFERTLYPLWGLYCGGDYNNYEQHITSSLSSEEKIIQEKCWEGKAVTEMLLRSMSIMMIVASALELCVVISSVVLGIKALGRLKSADDPELYKPLLEEVPAQPVA